MSRAPFIVRAAHATRLAWRVLTDPMIATGFGGQSYKGAEISALDTNWVASIFSPEDELRGSLRRLRARGRDIGRNSPQGSRFVDMFTTNVVGHMGFACKHRFRDASGELVDEVNKILDAEWYRFWEGPVTLDQRMCGVDFLQAVARTWPTDGEFFTRKWNGQGEYGLAFEPVDADRVDDTMFRTVDRGGSGRVSFGIEFDQFMRRTFYHVLRESPTFIGGSERDIIPASEMNHLYIPRRVNHPRAVTFFAPVISEIRTKNRHTEAELFASLAACLKMGFFEQNSDDPSAFDMTAALSQTGAKPGAAGSTQPKAAKMGGRPGSFEVLAKGLTFKPFDPSHPSTAYEAFDRAIKREIASGLNCSYNIHSNDGTAISFSTGRIFENADHDAWRVLQHFKARNLMNWIHEAWLETAVMSGRLKGLRTYNWRQFRRTATWMPRGWKFVAPEKDIEYYERAQALGICSPFQMSAELGVDFEEQIEEIARANAIAKKYGVKIGAEAKAAPAAPAAGDTTDPNDPNYGEPKDDQEATPRAAVLEAMAHTNGSGRH